MRRILAILSTLSVAASVQIGSAQPALPFSQPKPLPPESVTVTGTKATDEAIEKFEKARAQPTYVLGRMARWTKGVCPVTLGLADKYAKYITRRIKDVAAAVGAPVDGDPACLPNIEVMFTLNPEILMGNVRKTKSLLLGYHHNEREADELAKVTHPIQAWYTTNSQDLKGESFVDTGTCGTGGVTALNSMPNAPPVTADAVANGVVAGGFSLPCAVVVHETGTRTGKDGLTSGFFNIIIVADPSKLLDYEVGTLGDYIAMMALSQPSSLNSCQDLPSISNLLAKDCNSIPIWITDGDLAFLKGLYRTVGSSFIIQQNEILREMRKALVTDKGR